jgi:hypothetical protein
LAAESLGFSDPWEAVGIAHEGLLPFQETVKIAAFHAN